MGVDAMIYVSADGVSAERLAELGDKFKQYDDDGQSWIEYDTWQRYFGPTYPRGHWPTIREQIGEMRAAFPDRPVYYDGDNGWFGEVDPWTDDDMEQMDREWARWDASGLTYFDLFRGASWPPREMGV